MRGDPNWNRRFSYSMQLMAKRMKSIGARDFKVVGLPKTIEDLRKLHPFEFQN